MVVFKVLISGERNVNVIDSLALALACACACMVIVLS